MIKETLKKLIIRDLGKLKQEIETYQNEEKIWYIEKRILNSAGNLCLHLIGNLNTYIGAEYGKTGYVRNRVNEFALKNVPRAELVDKIEKRIIMIETTFDMMSEDQMNQKHPAEIFLERCIYRILFCTPGHAFRLSFRADQLPSPFAG